MHTALDALVLFQLNNYLVLADNYNYRQVMASYNGSFAQELRYRSFSHLL